MWDACRKPLTDNGLAVVQSPVFIPEHPEMIGLDTRLCHSSGEWLEGRIVMKPVKPDPQSYGSCLTYLRRYSLQSLVSICPEDDDGNIASGIKHEKKKVVEDVPDFTPDVTPVRYEEPPMDDHLMPLYGTAVEQPPENTDNGIHMIKVVSVKVKKEGISKAGKPWTLYEIVSATGKRYSTFSNSISSRLREGIEDGSLVPMKVKGAKYGVYEIEKIMSAEE